MPIYEYACKSCGERLEVKQSFSDDPLTACPVCGGPLRKVFGSIGIAFKGSGFYRTDARPAAAKAERAERDGKVDKPEKEGKEGKEGDKGKGETTLAKADSASSSANSASSSSSADGSASGGSHSSGGTKSSGGRDPAKAKSA